jgi:hypothetical protein
MSAAEMKILLAALDAVKDIAAEQDRPQETLELTCTKLPQGDVTTPAVIQEEADAKALLAKADAMSKEVSRLERRNRELEAAAAGGRKLFEGPPGVLN